MERISAVEVSTVRGDKEAEHAAIAVGAAVTRCGASRFVPVQIAVRRQDLLGMSVGESDSDREIAMDVGVPVEPPDVVSSQRGTGKKTRAAKASP